MCFLHPIFTGINTKTHYLEWRHLKWNGEFYKVQKTQFMERCEILQIVHIIHLSPTTLNLYRTPQKGIAVRARWHGPGESILPGSICMDRVRHLSPTGPIGSLGNPARRPRECQILLVFRCFSLKAPQVRRWVHFVWPRRGQIKGSPRCAWRLRQNNENRCQAPNTPDLSVTLRDSEST